MNIEKVFILTDQILFTFLAVKVTLVVGGWSDGWMRVSYAKMSVTSTVKFSS